MGSKFARKKKGTLFPEPPPFYLFSIFQSFSFSWDKITIEEVLIEEK